MKTQITCTIAALMLAGGAQAADIEWATPGTSGDWDVDSNWDGNQVPTASDTVILPKEDDPNPSDYTVTVDVNNAVAQAVDIQHETAGLDIVNGGTLTLGDDSDTQSTFDGQLKIEGGGELVVTDSPRFGGAESILGAGISATLTIADGETLMSQVLMEGGLTVQRGSGSGTATLDNRGTIYAHSDATFQFDENVELSDTASSIWKAGDSNANKFGVFDFRRDATLAGDLSLLYSGSEVLLGSATIGNVDIEVADLEMQSGTTIDIVGSNSSMAYSTFSGPCSGSEPSSPITADYTCTP